MALLSLATFAVSLPLNANAAKEHAADQTPEEQQILSRIYDLPGFDTPRPCEDYLPALSALYTRSGLYRWCLMDRDAYPADDKDIDDRILNISMLVSTGRLTPTIDAKAFSKGVDEILRNPDSTPFLADVHNLLDRTFPKWCDIEISRDWSTHSMGAHISTTKPLFGELAKLYFNRVDEAKRPRVLIIGLGRYNPKKSCLTLARCFPGYTNFLDCNAFSTGYYLNMSYDEYFYKDARWDYFLLDKNFKVRPDACLDIFDPDTTALLGKNQWDYIINDAILSEDFTARLIGQSKKLLKPGGKLLLAHREDLDPEKFDPSEDRLGDAKIVYEKPIIG